MRFLKPRTVLAFAFLALTATNRVSLLQLTPQAYACNACNFLLKWGAPGSGNGQFNSSVGVAVDGSGNVYVADRANDRVEKFTNTGTYISQLGCASGACSPGSGNGQFSGPDGVAVDGSGNVYVADRANDRVEKFTNTGTFILTWFNDQIFFGPVGVAVDSSGNVYVTEQSNRVQKFTNTGTLILTWGSAGSGNGEFLGPQGVAVDSSEKVYVVDTGNNRVQKFTNTGTFITKWGSGPGSGNGQFNSPVGVALDGSGNVYVADTGNNRVELFGDSTLASIGLVAGWNLISLPLIPVNTAIAKVLNDLIAAHNLTIVWSFQAGVWKSFTPPSTGTLTTLVDGLGYWILVTAPSRLIVLGGYVIAPAMAPPTYSLSAGWNLVGFKPQPDPAASENVTFYLQSLGNKYDNNNVWIFNNAPGTWTRATCDYAPGGLSACTQNLSPGQGFWVYMKAAGTLTP